MRELGLGVRIDSHSVTNCRSFSRCISVIELFGTSTSSKTIKSALDPVNWPVIPTLLTLGACAALAGPTSKEILDHL